MVKSIITKILSRILNREIELRERILRIIIIIGAIAAFIGTVETIFVSNENILLLPLIILLLAFGIAGVATFRYHKIDFSAMVIGVLIMVLVFPSIFFMNGGIKGGATIWFVIGIFYGFLIFHGKMLIGFLIVNVLATTCTYVLGYMYPQFIVDMPTNLSMYADSLFSVIVVGFSCGFLYRFQNKITEQEQFITQKQNEELEAVANSRTKFFTNMSHEFRTPLNTIVGLNEMIIRESNQEHIVEYAGNVSSAARILISLVNDILDLSKMEVSKMDIVEVEYDTKELINELVDIINVQMNAKKLTFYLDIDENIPSVLYGDVRHIEQVMLNLLNNAVKYTEKGHVTLSAYSEKVDDEHVKLHMSVVDTGIGIRKEDMESLYDIFKRVDRIKNSKVQGSGLGLTITKQLVNLMGGEIKVDSIYTKGSTFSITLTQRVIDFSPIDNMFDGKAKNADIIEKYQPSFEAPEARVLVVDDSSLNAQIVNLLLQKTGMQIDTASSGEECLEMTRRKYYDVILMDYQMSDMNGAETMNAIRKQENGLCRETAVIVLTANSFEDTVHIFEDNNFDGYLEKPIQPNKLENEIVKFIPEELIEYQISEDSGNELRIQSIHRDHRKRIIVTTDCVCDLPKELIELYNIQVMYLYIQTPEGRFADTKEIDADNLMQYMQNGKLSAKAVSVTVEEYEEFFANVLTQGEQIIHISMAKDSGKSYSVAVQAAQCFENVRIIDSGMVAGGQGLVVLQAARMAAEGQSMETICQQIEHSKEKVITRFILPNVDSFYANGYVDAFTANLLKRIGMHPLIGFNQSRICVVGASMGNLENAWRRFVRQTLRRKDMINTDMVIISHVGCTVHQLELLKQEILKTVPFERVLIQKTSFSNSCNSGLHSVGISFSMK